jgi:lipoprotein-releasing system permease protein
MNLQFFLARRLYGASDSRQQVSKPAVRIATAGVAIGLMVMIISVAVVSGFKREVSAKATGFAAHIHISSLDAVQSRETHPIAVSDSLMRAVGVVEGVAHVQRYATKPGMIKTDEAFQGMALKGIAQEYDLGFLRQYLSEGTIPEFCDSVSSGCALVSRAMANKLKLKLDDRIMTYYIQDNIRVRPLKIVGIYQTNFAEFDNLFVITDLHTVRRLNSWDAAQVSGLEVVVADEDILASVTDALAMRLDARPDGMGEAYFVQNVRQLNPQLFAWLDLLDTNVWVILVLMIGVAGFSMISGLLIIIIERTQTIGILKALGANDASISGTFLWFATFLVGRGMVIGNILGLGFCLVQNSFHIVGLDPETYYISSVPVAISWWWIVLLNVGTLAISVLVLLAPAAYISRIHPALAIRFE